MNKKLYIFYFFALVLIVIAVIVNLNTNTVKPDTTYYYNSYNQYSNNGKDNNITNGSEKTLISKVILEKNINALGFDTTPIVSGDIIFVGTMNKSDMGGSLYAIKRISGNILWNDNFSNWIMTNPVVVPSKDMVFVGSGNSINYSNINNTKVLYRGTGNNYIYGINLETGKIIWKYKTLGEDMPTPIYNDGVLYFANGNREFYALNSSNGKKLWSINIGSIVSMSSPVLIGNNVYFGGALPYKFFDINIKTKKIAWEDSFPKITGALDDTTPTYSQGYIYTNSTSLTNYSKNKGNEYLYKINASNGQIIWSINEGNGVINLPSDPMEGSVSTIVGNILYTSSNTTRKIFAVNIDTKKILWDFKVNGMVNSPFIVIKNLIYSITVDGNIYVLNIKNGKFVAKRTLGGPELASGLSFYSGEFYVTTGNGNFYIFK